MATATEYKHLAILKVWQGNYKANSYIENDPSGKEVEVISDGWANDLYNEISTINCEYDTGDTHVLYLIDGEKIEDSINKLRQLGAEVECEQVNESMNFGDGHGLIVEIVRNSTDDYWWVIG